MVTYQQPHFTFVIEKWGSWKCTYKNFLKLSLKRKCRVDGIFFIVTNIISILKYESKRWKCTYTASCQWLKCNDNDFIIEMEICHFDWLHLVQPCKCEAITNIKGQFTKGLTHCGPVTPCCVVDLHCRRFRQRLVLPCGAKPLHKPILTYCQLDPVEQILVNFPLNIFIQENTVCKMAAILFRLKNINTSDHMYAGLILDLRPANERWRYKVTPPSLTDWAQA